MKHEKTVPLKSYWLSIGVITALHSGVHIGNIINDTTAYHIPKNSSVTIEEVTIIDSYGLKFIDNKGHNLGTLVKQHDGTYLAIKKYLDNFTDSIADSLVVN